MEKTARPSYSFSALLRGLKPSELENSFRSQPSLRRDFAWLSYRQRGLVINLIKNNLLGGLLTAWDNLDQPAKFRILQDLQAVDLKLVRQNIQLHRRYLESEGRDSSSNCAQIKGPLDLPVKEDIPTLTALDAALLKRLSDLGKVYKENGHIGLLVMAAGSGSRLGRGPKALVKVDGYRTFIQIAAEDVLKASQKAGRRLPLFVMVTPSNAEDIKVHFTANRNFGLRSEQVNFFLELDRLPRIYQDGTLALDANNHRIDFYPTGHGYVLKGIKTQIAKSCRERGIKTLLIRNIDNLGATISDKSYDEVLGHHLSSGRGITVELVKPRTLVNPATGEEISADRGGGVFSLNGRNVIVELFAVPAQLQERGKFNPFNTSNMTIDLDAIDDIDPLQLAWYITRKSAGPRANDDRYQFEQLLGDATHQKKTNFVVVEREGPDGRFLPVKTPQDLEYSARVFGLMEKAKTTLL
jgi:UDP-N-acetylglucosamine pyrophosphorylase